MVRPIASSPMNLLPKAMTTHCSRWLRKCRLSLWLSSFTPWHVIGCPKVCSRLLLFLFTLLSWSYIASSHLSTYIASSHLSSFTGKHFVVWKTLDHMTQTKVGLYLKFLSSYPNTITIISVKTHLPSRSSRLPVHSKGPVAPCSLGCIQYNSFSPFSSSV